MAGGRAVWHGGDVVHLTDIPRPMSNAVRPLPAKCRTCGASTAFNLRTHSKIYPVPLHTEYVMLLRNKPSPPQAARNTTRRD
jgi:hypothetical protein